MTLRPISVALSRISASDRSTKETTAVQAVVIAPVIAVPTSAAQVCQAARRAWITKRIGANGVISISRQSIIFRSLLPRFLTKSLGSSKP